MTALDPSVPVAIVGAGTMGCGIAQIAALAGHPVLLHDLSADAARAAIDTVRERLDRLLEKQRITAERHEQASAALAHAPTPGSLAGAGLVIEAIAEDVAAKQALFARLEHVVGEDAILASNTSSLSITAIAAPLERPARLCGMHFFNPAPVMRLVEVISGLATDEAVAARVAATAEAWGKLPVRARSTPGFIVNRVARPFYAEAFRLLEAGAADAATLDAILRESGGFPMGPFELTDLIGQDINAATTQGVFEAFSFDRRYAPSPLQDELVAAGRLGRKSGRGFFDYGPDAVAPEPASLPPAQAPDELVVEGDPGPMAPLVELIRAAGIEVTFETLGRGFLSVDGCALALTDGRLAVEHSIDADRPVALLDLAFDYTNATRLAVALPEGLDPASAMPLVGLLQRCGKAVSQVRDLPGMVVMRTVAMLADEAASALQQGVASEADIDNAMVHGVRYPMGPLAWSKKIGTGRVIEVLDNMARLLGEERYRVAFELRRRALSATPDLPWKIGGTE